MEYISKGDRIDTATGHIIIRGFDGNVYTVDEYEAMYDEDGEQSGLIRTDTVLLTAHEIEKRMTDRDGHAHKIRYVEDNE